MWRRSTVRDPQKVAYVTQTTLSVDDTRDIIEALRQRFPQIIGPDVKDICYATQNRQQAVRDLVARVDMLLVVGAKNSSNSNRLREIGAEFGRAELPDRRCPQRSIRPGSKVCGRSASPPVHRRRKKLVQDLIDRLGDFGPVAVEELAGVEEHMQFKLPRELAATVAGAS